MSELTDIAGSLRRIEADLANCADRVVSTQAFGTSLLVFTASGRVLKASQHLDKWEQLTSVPLGGKVQS